MTRTTHARPNIMTALAIVAALGSASGAQVVPVPQPVPPSNPTPNPTPAPTPAQAPAPAPAPAPASAKDDGLVAPGPAGGNPEANDARPDGTRSAQNSAMKNEITPELDDAVNRGLAYLVTEQGPDGSFGTGRYGKNIAVTALACLALMADGNVPGRGPYGENVRKGLEFVLASSSETGLLAADSTNGPMYGHGFAALFLGEVYGMTQGGGETTLSTRVHEALVKACRLIERSQNNEGGWRYNPVPYDADVSVTICQIMALRSARNAGIEVPKETIDKAVEYVRQCQNPDGGFRYQLPQGFSAWPRSAAGVASLYYAGIYQDDAIERGQAYLIAQALPGATNPPGAHYFYGHYYSVQTMYLAGGDYWTRWWPAIRSELMERQQKDGSWADASVGPAYGTAMALIILQMPKRFLPIFQK